MAAASSRSETSNIRMPNLGLSFLLHGLKVESELIYSVFIGLTVLAASLIGIKKVDIGACYILSHSSKLNVNFVQFLQAFSNLSRDFFFTVHFCSLPGSVFFSSSCMCETENSHFLSLACKTLPDCRRCLNGKDVGYAALFHPHIYFSPSESSHKERKPQHLNSSNSFHLLDFQMSRSDVN